MMLKILKVVVLAVICINVSFAQSKIAVRKPQIKTIVIDAGHGGKDPGTSHGGNLEKNIALQIALKVGKKIQEGLLGTKVIFTRKTDVFIPLNERAVIANKNKADLFICIHVNANPVSSKPKGSETFVMGLHKSEENLELAKRENGVILLENNYKKTYKGYNPTSPIAHIMMANYQSAFMTESIELANLVEQNMKRIGHHGQGVKQAGFLVLWQTSMPGIYVETGYITNKKDEALLTSEKGQDKIAEAIFRAIKTYKEH